MNAASSSRQPLSDSISVHAFSRLPSSDTVEPTVAHPSENESEALTPPFDSPPQSRSWIQSICNWVLDALYVSAGSTVPARDLIRFRESIEKNRLARATRIWKKLHATGAVKDTNALICAAQHGGPAALQAMLPLSTPEHLDRRGFSFLDWIIMSGRLDNLQMALRFPIWEIHASLFSNAATLAVTHNWISALQLIVEHPSWQPEFGASCAQLAIARGKEDLFPLLAKGQCLDLPALGRGLSLVFEAMKHHHSHLIGPLLAYLPLRHSEPNAPLLMERCNSNGHTPLMRAVRLRDATAVAALLPHSNHRQRDLNGNSALALSILNNAPECCAILAQQTPWNQPVCDANHPALKLAILWEAPECIEVLLQRQPRPKLPFLASKTNEMGSLSTFVRELIDDLFKLNRSTKPTQPGQDSVLLRAFKALLEHGNPAPRNADGVELLKGAFFSTNLEYAQYLCENGHIPTDFPKRTLLHLAVTSGRPDHYAFVYSTFHADGVDGPSAVNARDDEHETPLSLAAQLFSRKTLVGLRRRDSHADSLKCLRLFWPHANADTRQHAWSRAVALGATGALEEMAPQVPIEWLQTMFAEHALWPEKMPVSRSCVERAEMQKELDRAGSFPPSPHSVRPPSDEEALAVMTTEPLTRKTRRL